VRKNFIAKDCAASSGNFTTTSIGDDTDERSSYQKISCAQHFKIFRYTSKSKLAASCELLLLNIAFGRGVQIAKNFFPPKNLYNIYIYIYIYILASDFAPDILVLDTRCLCCCCCLRMVEPRGLELLNLGPTSYPLVVVERIILELPDVL
jgi:hypothetical protein